MPLVNPKTMLQKAFKNHYAVGAFNVNNMEIGQAIIHAAAKTNSPIFIQVSKGAREYAETEDLVAIVKAELKKHPKVKAVLHQDHGPDYETCKTAIQAGFNSVMIDASHLPFEENIKLTKKVVEYAHKHNVPVEAELGELVGAQFDIGEGGKIGGGKYTDPEAAKEFVRLTGCDSLAISIGTSHGVYKFAETPKLDFKRLEQIHKIIPKMPLVLHGASSVLQKYVTKAEKYGAKIKGARGVPETMLKKSTKYGIAKINVDSDLRLALTATLREYMKKHPEEVDPRKYLGEGRDELEKLIIHKFKVLGCFGKA